MLIVSLILLQVLIFGVLVVVFRRILTQNVVSATKHLEVLNEDFSRKELELNKQLAESKQRSEETILQAKDEAERLKAQMLKEAEAKKDEILNEAYNKSNEIIQQADKSRQQLLLELEERIEFGSIEKACELTRRILPDDFKKRVHLKCIEEVLKGGFSSAERLHIPEGIKEAEVASAFKLSEEQQKSLAKRLKEMVGHEIVLKERLDEKVVAGMIVKIGSLVLDASLASRIKEESKK